MIMDALTSQTSVCEAEAFDIEAGWSRLAAGERGLRSPSGTAAERAFNQIAAQLEASALSATGAASVRDFTGDASGYVAAMSIKGLSHLRRELGSSVAGRTCDLVLLEGKALSEAQREAAEVLADFAGEARAARIAVLWAGEAEEAGSLRAVGADLVVQKPIAAGELPERLRELFAADVVADAA